LRPAKKGEARFAGRRHSEASKRLTSATLKARAEAKRLAAEHVAREDVRRELLHEAERAVVLDAIEILRAGEPEAAQRLLELVRQREDGALSLQAIREAFDRVRGRPIQVQANINANTGVKQMSLAEIEAELAQLKKRAPRLIDQLPGLEPGGRELQRSEDHAQSSDD
jgi:ABC-type phosphate transport system auxiliary subunit